jgi:poly [ADP-ribose] polymerase 7/11/12/13
MEVRRQRQGNVQSLPPIEKQLFHGTRSEDAVQSIFRENFDWRLSGSANDSCYGRGAYFAMNANFSDRYANCDASANRRLSWMFLARVLVGRSAVGRREYVRPPPLVCGKRNGELYDSCVNDLRKPVVFVIFDTDQCYPEYVISYTRA